MKHAPILLIFAAALTAQSFKFDFGAGKPAEGYTKVIPSTIYSDERGYGFEPGASIQARDSGVTSDKPPFYFSVKVASEGNYRVTATFGDVEIESLITVKAELRRLMLEKLRLEPGDFKWKTFLVNVRTPKYPGGEVKLKDREKTSEAWAWDNCITLEFTNQHPAVSRIEIEKADDVPTLYIAGDSTSTDQPLEPYNSWGQMLTRFFKPVIAVANHGESGESLRSFIGEGRLAKLMSVIKPGDWLFIQMGHNDQKETGEDALSGYKANLKRFIEEARQHEAVPVLITSMHRLKFDDAGKIVNTLGDYPDAVRLVADEEDAPLIDLNAMSAEFYEALGPKDAPKAFAGSDTTHHSDYGSYELAKCVVEGIRKAGLPLAKMLAEDTPRFDPAHPDPPAEFDIPAEPPLRQERLYGQ